eukprot:Nk52_evm68s1444 gene=Nk52_evmTU68s1444
MGNAGSHVGSEKWIDEYASKSGLSRIEIQHLWNRFKMFNPHTDGTINITSLQKEPYSSDPFLLKLIQSDPSGNISFEKYIREITFWKTSSAEIKLKRLFDTCASFNRPEDSIPTRCLSPNGLLEVFRVLSSCNGDFKSECERLLSMIDEDSEPHDKLWGGNVTSATSEDDEQSEGDKASGKEEESDRGTEEVDEETKSLRRIVIATLQSLDKSQRGYVTWGEFQAFILGTTDSNESESSVVLKQAKDSLQFKIIDFHLEKEKADGNLDR